MSRTERNAVKQAEKKRAVRLLRLRDCVVVLVCVIMALAYIGSLNQITPEPEYAFVGGTSKDVPVYLIGIPVEDEDVAEEVPEGSTAEESKDTPAEAVEIGRLVRGTSVKKLLGTKEIDGAVYCRVENTGMEGAADLYMREENLVPSSDMVVQETEVFVRTPVTIYSEESGPSIASFAPKGTCLKVTGYDKILPDGSVHKYKVEYEKSDGTGEGYVYNKYLAETQEEADRVYNENGIYDTVKKDKYGYDLYVGKAENLDYYPYEKT